MVKNSSKYILYFYFRKEPPFYFIKLEMVTGNILERLYRLFYKYWSGLRVFRARHWLGWISICILIASEYDAFFYKIEILGFGGCFLNLKGRNSIL